MTRNATLIDNFSLCTTANLPNGEIYALVMKLQGRVTLIMQQLALNNLKIAFGMEERKSRAERVLGCSINLLSTSRMGYKAVEDDKFIELGEVFVDLELKSRENGKSNASPRFQISSPQSESLRAFISCFRSRTDRELKSK